MLQHAQRSPSMCHPADKALFLPAHASRGGRLKNPLSLLSRLVACLSEN
jgi:hypothetical protein